jgi:hypothetical protein
MSIDEAFTECMAQVSEYVSNVDASVVDSIPEALLLFVRQSGVDPNFR